MEQELCEEKTEYISTAPAGEGEYQKHYYVSPAQKLPSRSYLAFKRAADLMLSFIGMIVFAIPMVLLTIIVAIDSPGAPIYSQKRLGIGGRVFTIYKFRSMWTDAEVSGPQWAKPNDVRCTRIGHFLRRFHLDELPQLWNIFKGDMSFVGPRPERPCFYNEFEKYVHGFRNRLAVRPGLTGLAQVNGGYELPPEQKIVYDMRYIENCSFKLDIECVRDTFKVVFKRKGK